MNPDNVRIAIIGLGYVGLPLAVEFGKHFPTIGFDLKQARIDELRAGQDSTLETTATRNTGSPPSKRSPAVPHPKPPPSSILSTAASSKPAPARPPASASPKPPRSSKTPSAT
ncbi:hypothetical protein [Methylococcus sp. Mc7]|uniref:hypothetical protein n=1 Tax=Methylococcus sp. Mc7 TaxID=2860258 RepID=UPI00272EE257|nr:hypothetical protein [Methylococcus sp. Mc7]